MAKDQFKPVAKDVFERFPEADECFITGDGQSFLNSHHAKTHATTNRTKQQLEVHTFLRSELKEKTQAPKTPEAPKTPAPPKDKKTPEAPKAPEAPKDNNK
jgi:hypothetical protein